MHPLEKTNYSDVIKITIFLSWGIIFSAFSLIQTATATAANRKSHLKSKTALLQTLSRLYYSISFSSSNVGISFWRILKDCIEVQEKKRKSLSCLYVLHRSEIRYFHVVVVQWWRRNVQKSVHEQSCCFAKLSLLFFCRSRWRCHRRCSQMWVKCFWVLTWIIASQVMCLSGLIITPYRGIRIPESGKFGDPENFARGIRNPGLWNPEYRLRNKESH